MNANRDKGIRWELKCMSILKALFPNMLSSRYASRIEDDNCIDLVNTGDFAFQCKATSSVPKLHQVFSDMNTDKTKVILWKNTKIRGDSGQFAIMKIDDFTQLLNGRQILKNKGQQ